MSCPNDRRINVTNAHFGQYDFYHPCESECCAPIPYQDCTELVVTNYPEVWALLQYTCYNQTSCSYEYKGNVINDCEQGYMADYMEIFYSCLPGKSIVTFVIWNWGKMSCVSNGLTADPWNHPIHSITLVMAWKYKVFICFSVNQYQLVRRKFWNDSIKWFSLSLHYYAINLIIFRCCSYNLMQDMSTELILNIYNLWILFAEAKDVPVGFSAYATTARAYDANDIALFDGIISNFGEHYNKDSSSFICPYSGVYLFSIAFVTYPSYDSYLGIMMDDTELVVAFADDGDQFSQASANIIAECVSGQRVWVRTISSSNYVYSNSDRYSHFTGYLLHRY